MDTTLPWMNELDGVLPGASECRARDGAAFVRIQDRVVRVRPGRLDELRMRARAPQLFPPAAGVIPRADGFFLIERPMHGRRLDRAGSDTRYRQLAALVWTLHAHGHDVEDIVLARMIATDAGVRLLELPGRGEEHRAATALAWARAFLTSRRATAGLRADNMAALVMRILGGEEAAGAMVRAALEQLPDGESWRAWAGEQFKHALGNNFPRIITANDADQGAAIHALLCEAAVEHGTPGGDGPGFTARGGRRVVRLLGPTDAKGCAARLGRLSPCPTLAVVVGAPLDVSRELEHVGEVVAPVALTSRGVFNWLRPLRAESSTLAEELVPALCDAPLSARQTVAALIERSGARMAESGPGISPGWVEHWRAIRGTRNAMSVVQPDAARVAKLLGLSPGGLSAKGVDDSSDLRRGANLLEDIGLAVRDRGTLRPAEGARMPPVDVSTRRALLQWLSERDWLAPDARPLYREAWRLSLRMRAGDLACWHDDNAERVFNGLIEERAYVEALQLIEAHAAGSVGTPGGPPSVDVLFAARDLGLALWKPERLRRLFRMWLRNYDGETRALGLALQAYVERRIGGVNAYAQSVRRAESSLEGLSRFPREQALIELAMCVCNDDPGRALEYLKGVAKNPARNATYLCDTRMLLVKAECEFVAVKPEQALAYIQQARESIGRRAHRTRRMRLAGELEVRHIGAFSMTRFYRVDIQRLMEPLRELEFEYACLGDLVSASVVSDRLMRMRLNEVGASTPEEIDSVLAEARIHNLRGYLIALFQLEENALYRGDLGIAHQLASRMHILNREGEHNHAVHAAWCRHEAFMLAAAGKWKRALTTWRRGRNWHMAEPWRSRADLLRYGEWSMLLMMAGRYRKARRHARRVFRGTAEMGAGGRGAPYFVVGVLADLLCGDPVSAEDREHLGQYVQKGFALPRIIKFVVDAVDGTLDWSSLIDRVHETDAPAFWKCTGLCVAAVIARRGRVAAADELARAARALIDPSWGFLSEWLASEFPTAAARGDELGPGALRALADLRLPDEPSISALAEAACEAVERAVSGSGACVQFGVSGPAVKRGDVDGRLADALERALLGDKVAEDGCFAIGLRTPFGAVAARSAEPGEEVMPALEAIAQRLGELHELGETRNDREQRRRRARDAVRAGWELASGDPSPARKLSALRALLTAETGADDAALAVLREGNELLRAGALTSWSGESAHAVDHALTLRARIAGGDVYALDESTRRAAESFASILAHAPERLRLELGRPGEDEELAIAGEKIGTSPGARKLYNDLRRFADVDMPLTIVGEPGSGKDLAARAVHALSRRAASPHVVIDCATLRRETAPSELFGHVRGAFTGATSDHAGLLERAGEGTLQVDHIGDLEPSIQAMLLRAFQVRSFLPMGALTEKELHARIVVTSGRTLDELVKAEVLREDLAQRLAGITLNVPPLRARGGDALVIARDMLEKQSRQLGRNLRFSKSAEDWIRKHNWPGNVRELRAGVMRASVVADGEEITPDDILSAHNVNGGTGLTLPSDAEGLNTTERLILGSLRQHGEASTRALTGPLGLSRTTVSTTLSKLTQQGLARRRGRGRATRYVAL